MLIFRFTSSFGLCLGMPFLCFFVSVFSFCPILCSNKMCHSHSRSLCYCCYLLQHLLWPTWRGNDGNLLANVCTQSHTHTHFSYARTLGIIGSFCHRCAALPSVYNSATAVHFTIRSSSALLNSHTKQEFSALSNECVSCAREKNRSHLAQCSRTAPLVV